MELPTVRFPTDSTYVGRLEAAARKAAEDPSIRAAEVVEGFGNGLDIKVVLASPEDEAAALDAIERSLPEGISVEILPVDTQGDGFSGFPGLPG
jgi:hypothetical protein